MLSESAQSNAMTLLQREKRLLYPIVDYEVQNYLIYQGTKYRTTADSVLSGKPRRIYILFIKSENFSG